MANMANTHLSLHKNSNDMAKPFENGEFGRFGEYGEMTNLMLKGPLWLWLFWQKWRIWRKFCHRFGEYSNWVAEGVPWIVDFVENGKSGENTKMRKLARGHLQNINMTRLALLTFT